MPTTKRLKSAAVVAGLMAATALAGCSSGDAAGSDANGCPNGGTVRWGVEPYDDVAMLKPLYKPLGDLLSKKLGCQVQVTITNNYTSEVEAMRNKKLEFGEFGPLGYLLAKKVAGGEVVAAFSDGGGKPATYTASVVTWKGSGIKTLKDCKGKKFGYSDPASTSGHLEPAYALHTAGIDPDKGVKPVYSGSHTASYEALRNHKTDCNELNSQTIATAKDAGEYKASDYKVLWKSGQIPLDPLVVRGDLDPKFKKKLTSALESLDFTQLPPKVQKGLKKAISGSKIVPQNDAAFNTLRTLVKVLHLDLTKTQG